MTGQTFDSIPREFKKLARSMEKRAQQLAHFTMGANIDIVKAYIPHQARDGEFALEFKTSYRGTNHQWAFIIGTHHYHHFDRIVEESCRKILLHRSKTAAETCTIKIDID